MPSLIKTNIIQHSGKCLYILGVIRGVSRLQSFKNVLLYIIFLWCIPKTNLSNHKINYKHKSKEPKKFTVCLVAVHFLVKGYKNVIFGVFAN